MMNACCDGFITSPRKQLHEEHGIVHSFVQSLSFRQGTLTRRNIITMWCTAQYCYGKLSVCDTIRWL